MKNIDTMTLAWKILKSSTFIKKFSFALKLAWKILKQSTMTLENNIVKIISSKIKEFNLFIVKNSGKNKVEFEDTEYNFNLFSYEVYKNL